MKVAIVGATGPTGLELVQQTIDRGHQVTALVRNPDKLNSFTNRENLKIVKADLMNSDELAQHLEGQECVLSALGSPGFHLFKLTFYLDSIKSLVNAMRKAKVQRLLCITAFYTKPDDSYPNVYKYFLRPMIGRQLDSMYEMEEWLFKEAGDIDYTIVRPPRLLTVPISEQEVVALADKYLTSETANQIPRANVAKFMLEEMEKNEFVKKAVAIDMPKAA